MKTNFTNHGSIFHGKRILTALSIALLSCFAVTSVAQADDIQYCGSTVMVPLSPPNVISGQVNLVIRNGNILQNGVAINASPLLFISLAGDQSVQFKSTEVKITDSSVSNKAMKYKLHKIVSSDKTVVYIITNDVDSTNGISQNNFSSDTLFNVFMSPAPFLNAAVLDIEANVKGDAGNIMTGTDIKIDYGTTITYTMQSCSLPGGIGGGGGTRDGVTPPTTQPIASTGILPQ
ncbi:MAG: hypothetical protein K0R14_871 [Burkholderiales bacterium]|jgi:hypothetical protein|nr:hypothetical protein [Burkholderiales bacterium]